MSGVITRQATVYLIIAVLVLTGCGKSRPPGEQHVQSGPQAPQQHREAVTSPQQYLTYHDRKAQGLLTKEELREEQALQQVEHDISVGRVDYVESEHKKVLPPQIPSVYSSPEEAAEADRLREMGRRYTAEARRQIPDPSLTIEYIDTFQSPGKGGKRYTDAQRKYNWERMFAGRRVRWTGTVEEVSELVGSYTVALRCGSTAIGADTRFDVPEDVALRLQKGSTITVEGTLSDHSAFGYRLTDVHIK